MGPSLRLLLTGSWAVVAIGCADDPAGGECDSDRDCAVGVCRADPNAEPADLVKLPLICGQPDDAGETGEPCSGSDGCSRGICLLAGACVAPCADDDDCEDGSSCRPLFACTSIDALQPLHGCVEDVSLPDDAIVEVDIREGVLSGAVDRVDLPPVEQPTLFVLEHLSDDVWPDSVVCRPPICINKLETLDPTPLLLYDYNAVIEGGPAPLNPIASGAHLYTPVIMLPNGPRSVSSDAGYTMTLETEVAGDLKITRLSRRPEGMRLDLNVFYVGALGWAVQGDRGPRLLSEGLEELDRIFGQADIFVGEVRQLQVRGGLLQRGVVFAEEEEPRGHGFATLEDKQGVNPELPDLFRLSAGAANTAINLFFVGDILGGNSDREAMSGGTPGPMGMHGTGSSGIVISADMMADAADLGRTLAHELGHFMGLFHTSEKDGLVFDPLPDTPECRPEMDLDGDGLQLEDCEGAGNDNLMFWTKTQSSLLTDDQQDILRAALVLQ